MWPFKPRHNVTVEVVRARRKSMAMVVRGEAFQCPACLYFSANPHDVANQYCTCCGGPLLPKRCAHDPLGAVGTPLEDTRGAAR